MELQIQSIRIPTGYICKYCNRYFSGQYVFLNGQMYVKGDCKCSYWLVKSDRLNETFYYFRVA